MKDQKLPSDALTKPARRAPWIISLVAGVGIATAAVIAGPSIAAQLNPAPTPTPTLAPYVSPPLSPAELSSVQQGAEQQRSIIAADEAAQAAAAAAAAKAAADQQDEESAGLPRGAVVPSIPGTTSPDTTKCASGTASDNASGVAICD